MKFLNILFLNVILIITISCNIFSDKEYLYNKNDILHEDKLLLVETHEGVPIKAYSNSKIIKEKLKQIYVKSSDECHGTTSDGGIVLFKNGKQISQLSYCKFYFENPELDGLENQFKSVKLKTVFANNFNEKITKLDSLKRINNFYLINSDEDNYDDYNYLVTFYLNLREDIKDPFTFQKTIKQIFERNFENIKYEIQVDFSSYTAKTNSLEYKILINCSENFLKELNWEDLNKLKYFDNITGIQKERKKLKIEYFQW